MLPKSKNVVELGGVVKWIPAKSMRERQENRWCSFPRRRESRGEEEKDGEECIEEKGVSGASGLKGVKAAAEATGCAVGHGQVAG